MNAKYASKPNFNPNKADLSRQVVPNPFTGERPADPGRHSERSEESLFSLVPGLFSLACIQKQTQFFCGQLWIFTPKTQKWRPKRVAKKRNKPICG
jgi:hypothetical protein